VYLTGALMMIVGAVACGYSGDHDVRDEQSPLPAPLPAGGAEGVASCRMVGPFPADHR
jgi:hypothetical protein